MNIYQEMSCFMNNDVNYCKRKKADDLISLMDVIYLSTNVRLHCSNVTFILRQRRSSSMRGCFIKVLKAYLNSCEFIVLIGT